MNLQYISDSKGKTTGVFIPIKEWEALKSKYKGLGDNDIDVPEWHKELVINRIKEYRKDPGKTLDFDTAMDDIEKEL